MSLKRIYHIADVHIRNVKRHKEYREVFEKMFEEIRKRGTEDSIIYLAGDIAHAKLEMSPELVSEIVWLFKELKRYQRSLNSDRNRESIEDKLKKIVVLLKKFVKSKKDQINLDMNRTEIINLNDDQTESEGDSEGDSDHDEQEHHSDSEPENEESKIGESHHNSHAENREINLDSESNQEDLGIDYARINEPRIISLEEEKDLEEINLEELKDQNDSSLEFDLRGIFLIKKHSSTLREKDKSNLVMNTFFSNSKRFFLILMS